MIGNSPDRGLIREYLLGRLDEDGAAETKISEDILFDNDFADVVDSVEDEIFEAYLEGSLNEGDRVSAEEYFLQPPERQQKLRFMRLLEQHLNASVSKQAVRADHSDVRHGKAAAWWRSPLWAYGQVAAIMVLSLFSTGYIFVMHKKQTALQNDLNQERAVGASLKSEVSQERELTANLKSELSRRSPSIQIQSFASGLGFRRSDGTIPLLELKTSTKYILFEVGVGRPRVAYNLQLKRDRLGELVWTATLLPIISDAGDGRLVFDLPAGSLQPGSYSLSVSEASGGAHAELYKFVVTLQK